ncbi:MAG: hypothetical protein ABIR57_02390, partial [Aeromicrobium sp.]
MYCFRGAPISRTFVVLIAIAAFALPAGAADAAVTDPSPQDYVKELAGIISSLAETRPDMLRCPTLAGGTAGVPENASIPSRTGDTGNPLVAGQKSDAPKSLPQQVHLRGATQTYNRRYQFAISGGVIWYKSNTAVTKIVEPWSKLPTSPCFDRKVTEISADDDEMIA